MSNCKLISKFGFSTLQLSYFIYLPILILMIFSEKNVAHLGKKLNFKGLSKIAIVYKDKEKEDGDAEC